LPAVRSRALVLHAFPYGDTSRILRLLTPEHGLRSVIAKGARSPRSRFGGILEPFTEGEAHFHLREGRDLLVLSDFSLLRSRQGIGRGLGAFAGASLIAEIALRHGTEEPHPELYDSIVAALDQLAAAPAHAAAIALGHLWSLVSILGFEPLTDCCVRCGRSLDLAGSTRFDVDAGGLACLACGSVGRILTPSLHAQLRAMTRRHTPPTPLADRHTHAALLEAFLSAHVAPDRPLRSLPLFLEHLR
jgi:DNA repair protein RecO (recombination protein O)